MDRRDFLVRAPRRVISGAASPRFPAPRQIKEHRTELHLEAGAATSFSADQVARPIAGDDGVRAEALMRETIGPEVLDFIGAWRTRSTTVYTPSEA